MSEEQKDRYFRRCIAQNDLYVRLRSMHTLLDWLYTELPGNKAHDLLDGEVVNHRMKMLYNDVCCMRFNVAFLGQWLEQEIATRRPP